MRKLMFAGLITIGLLAFPGRALADHEAIICPQPYGGGVVCGVKTHKPVEAGLAENLALFGAFALGASGFTFYLAKKNQKQVQPA